MGRARRQPRRPRRFAVTWRLRGLSIPHGKCMVVRWRMARHSLQSMVMIDGSMRDACAGTRRFKLGRAVRRAVSMRARDLLAHAYTQEYTVQVQLLVLKR